MQFASALSKTITTARAAQELVDEIRPQLGDASIDLACVFFSSHHAAQADHLTDVLTSALGPRCLLGCSGEGVISGTEELEASPAITVWAASLPDVDLCPIRSSFSPTQDQFQLAGWPDPWRGRRPSLCWPIPLQLRCRKSSLCWKTATPVRRWSGAGRRRARSRGESADPQWGRVRWRHGRGSPVGGGGDSTDHLTRMPSDRRAVCRDQGRAQSHSRAERPVGIGATADRVRGPVG